MLLENNDCDIICEGCELEHDQGKCFELIFTDIDSIENQKTEEE